MQSRCPHKMIKRWDYYNSNTRDVCLSIYRTPQDAMNEVEDGVLSYTHAFFEEHHLTHYLNVDCNKIVQLGASNGKFLADYKKEGWNVLAYDFSQPALEYLSNNGINAKCVDLNDIDGSGKLCYSSQLAADIHEPVNILMIRILQYLDVEAVNLLLFTLMQEAAPGSVFFIAGNTRQSECMSTKVTSATPRYKATFFAPRTDMELLLCTQVNADDELLVIRKR